MAPVVAAVLAPPDRVPMRTTIATGRVPALTDLVTRDPSPELIAGGEEAARGRLDRWLADGVADYDAGRDDLGSDATSRLSADLHFGWGRLLAHASAGTRARTTLDVPCP